MVWLGIFWLMQAGAQILFNLGAGYERNNWRYWLFWGLGNVPGASSILVLMRLYRLIDINLALALGGGGAFIAAQLALAGVFRNTIQPLQYVAMVLIALGMGMFSYFAKQP